MDQQSNKVITAENCWDIAISARDESELQIVALKKHLEGCETILQTLNIFRNNPVVEDEAIEKLFSFANNFEGCIKVLREVSYIPKLKMLIRKRALGFATTIKEHQELLEWYEENSEGAYICTRRINELKATKPTRTLAYAS